MRLPHLALCLFVLGGALAGWCIAGLVPAGLRQPHLHGKEFVLTRSADNPVEVTEARWCFLPFLFGDFDLQLEVELAERTELDLLLRQVQPRLVGDRLVPFTERFTSLRLSTVQNGPPWWSAYDAIAAPRTGGVDLAPGLAATVWVQGRGRMLRANVAGKWQPWFEAEDEYGMVTLIARGGNAVVHGLRIQDLGQAGAFCWARWFWMAIGGLGALVIAGGAMANGVRSGWLLAAAPLVPLLAALLVRRFPHDLQWPQPGGMVALLVVALAPGLLWPRGWWRLAVLVMVLAAGYLAQAALSRPSSPMDVLFGLRAGAQPSEALAQLVRGPRGLHDLAEPRPRVFLLGGQPLYDRGEPGDHLELRLHTELRGTLKKPASVACMPTVDGSAVQQFWLYATCYAKAYRPEVVVFGVGEDAGFDGAPAAVSSLAVILSAAQTECIARGSKLVLFASADLPPPLLDALRWASERDSAPLVLATRDQAPAVIAKSLAAAIAPLLR